LTVASHLGQPEPPIDAEQARASRNANVAAIMTFAAFLGLGFALPFLPLFVQELGVTDLGDAAQWAGVLIGIGPLLAGLLAPFWGGLADRHGYKRVALLALTAIGLSQIVASVARTPIHVLVSRVLSGLFGGVGPLGLAMASPSGPRTGGSSKAIGKIQAAQILAAGFGPLMGGALASSLGIRAAFSAAALSCLFAAGVVGFFYVEEARVVPGPGKDGAPAVAAPPGDFFKALLFMVFFVNFASRSFTPILPAQLSTFGVPHPALALSTGLLISVYSIAAAVSSFGFGRLAAKTDPARLLGLSLLASLLAALAMAYMATFAAFLGVALIYGLVSGGTLTLGYSIGSRRFTEAARGASFGRLSGAALIGGAIAPAIAAFVARPSLHAVYWMNALIYAALILVASRFLRGSRAGS
jgi:DHA1 family multidrug resistance protein-like MFS transporter